MFSIKKLFAISILIFMGGVSLFESRCSAYDLTFSFSKNSYRINCENKFKLNRDYSSISEKIFEYIKTSGLMNTHKTVKITENDFENFKSAFIPLKKELMYIDKHSDYNSDDYIPVTSEIENSLNEKYINLFKFILLVSSMQ